MQLIKLVVISIMIFSVSMFNVGIHSIIDKAMGQGWDLTKTFNPATLLYACPKSGTFVNGCL